MKIKRYKPGQLLAMIVILVLGVLLACALGPAGVWGHNVFHL